MTKLDLQTPDFVAANAARLAELFPNCVTESRNGQTGEIKRAIDFDLLRQELAYDLVEGPQERYRLDWPGKREALTLANAPIRKTLRPCPAESVDFDTTRNLYLEGDNLDALKLLQETYLGKVKMFYIDPPYNTGNDFIYDDNFSISGEEHDLLSGTRDEEGNAMFQEEKWKQNSSASGRFHSEWLSMMYPRLKLARNLLRNDGVIFISIDDGEVANLRRVCDEIFGESNFVAEIVWEGANKNTAQQVGVSHEYVVVYAKSKETLERNWSIKKDDVSSVLREVARLKKLHGDDFDAASDDLAGWYRAMKGKPAFAHRRFRYIDGRGVYKEDDPTAPGGRKFQLVDPRNGNVIPLRKNRGWSFDQSEFNRLVSEERISFITESTIMVRRYLHETDRITPPSVFYQPARSASERLASLLESSIFPFPKDELVLKSLVEMAGGEPCGDSIIVDFFSGSATTAHAVMQLNAEDGGNRRHIMVQLPEPCVEKSEAFKAGFRTIAEIGKERIRRAGKKVLAEWQAKQAKEKPAQGDLLHPRSTISASPSPPDIGFRVLKIDSSNMADVYYQPDEITQDGLMLQVDNLRPGRKPEDLLFQVLLDWGVDLALPITEETILNRRVFFVDDRPDIPGAQPEIAACFDTGLDEAFVKELAKRIPQRAVFRDSGYASDAVKINFEQIFKALSPHTELKTL
jgi:adenine-specific DNA-methyltransferase